MHTRHLARIYRLKLTPEKKQKFELKILAEFLFKGKKKTYQSSFPKWFETNRLESDQKDVVDGFVRTQINGEKIMVSFRYVYIQ